MLGFFYLAGIDQRVIRPLGFSTNFRVLKCLNFLRVWMSCMKSNRISYWIIQFTFIQNNTLLLTDYFLLYIQINLKSQSQSCDNKLQIEFIQHSLIHNITILLALARWWDKTAISWLFHTTKSFPKDFYKLPTKSILLSPLPLPHSPQLSGYSQECLSKRDCSLQPLLDSTYTEVKKARVLSLFCDPRPWYLYFRSKVTLAQVYTCFAGLDMSPIGCTGFFRFHLFLWASGMFQSL